jgi:hypothetical protein
MEEYVLLKRQCKRKFIGIHQCCDDGIFSIGAPCLLKRAIDAVANVVAANVVVVVIDDELVKLRVER